MVAERSEGAERIEVAGGRAVLWRGDCLDVLRALPDDSVDCVITDPPYGLSAHSTEAVADCLRVWINGERYDAGGKGFMGKAWDAWVPGPEVWREVIRVLKPGGHALIFAGTRSLDLMGIALRLAGFELRDTIGHAHDGGGAPLMGWCFGTGFPKGSDISKAIDRELGMVREVVGESSTRLQLEDHDDTYGGWKGKARTEGGGVPITIAASEVAQKWIGWNTSLKPAFEPILLCRKPLAEGTIAANVVKHGTGGLNIGACRVGYGEQGPDRPFAQTVTTDASHWGGGNAEELQKYKPQGRWPANLILSYPGDEYMLRDDVTPDQLHKLAEWMNENAKR